jgi:glycosyltransferase involved in cell wall biosynthesis
MEAGVLSKPVIIGDTRDYLGGIRDGVSGLVVPPGDYEVLTEAMGRILEILALGEQFGILLKHLVTRKFCPERSIVKLKQLLLNEARA